MLFIAKLLTLECRELKVCDLTFTRSCLNHTIMIILVHLDLCQLLLHISPYVQSYSPLGNMILGHFPLALNCLSFLSTK